MMKLLYNIYIYVIVFPIAIVLTLFTSIVTILFFWCPNSAPIHEIQMFWSRSFFRLMFIPVTIEGIENLEKGKSYVFVGNHQSMFDVWLVYGWLPVVFKWMMKKELGRIPFVGTACRAAGHVMVDRSNPRAAVLSMQRIKQALQGGACTVIFPEGTRTPTGKVGPFKRGAFKIALDLKLPVVPLSISGCYEMLPKGKWIFSWHPVKLVIGTPQDLSGYTPEQENEAIEHVRKLVIDGCMLPK